MNDKIVFHSVASDRVVSTELGTGLALLDLRNNEYFTLDAIGAFIWNRMRAPQTRGELIQAIVDEYETTAENCAGDVDALLQDLTNAALVEAQPSHPA